MMNNHLFWNTIFLYIIKITWNGCNKTIIKNVLLGIKSH